jgi:hypothetical protein
MPHTQTTPPLPHHSIQSHTSEVQAGQLLHVQARAQMLHSLSANLIVYIIQCSTHPINKHTPESDERMPHTQTGFHLSAVFGRRYFIEQLFFPSISQAWHHATRIDLYIYIEMTLLIPKNFSRNTCQILDTLSGLVTIFAFQKTASSLKPVACSDRLHWL